MRGGYSASATYLAVSIRNVVAFYTAKLSAQNDSDNQVGAFVRHAWRCAAYTWSHDLDDSTATLNTTILTPRRPQDFQDLRAEWASSALDRRHRLTFTPIYDFKPFLAGSWLMREVVGNWTISATYTFQSPEFATVQSGLDSNLNGDAVDRTIINPGGAATAGSGVTAYNAQGQTVAMGNAATVAYVANNPNARYIQAGYGAYANAGRNTLPLAPTNNFDAAPD